MKVIFDDFEHGKAGEAEVSYAKLPRETVELFAALGHTDAKAWLNAHPPKKGA